MNSIRICPAGHTYTKSTDCPTCPVCENAKKPQIGWQAKLSAPANRALEREGITTLAQIAQYSRKEMGKWHGIGPKVLQLLSAELADAGLAWKED